MDRKSKILKRTASRCQEYETKSTSLSNMHVNLRPGVLVTILLFKEISSKHYNLLLK